VRVVRVGGVGSDPVQAADKSSAQVTSLIIDAGLSAVMPFALALFI
jgi:hypothetical protein